MSAGGQWHPTYFGLKGNSLQRLNQERGISMAKKKFIEENVIGHTCEGYTHIV
jgi:hypothetical protein